jgi:N-acetylglucosaminyl-diphospho-decaprenol L-rhamnosyltransferase
MTAREPRVTAVVLTYRRCAEVLRTVERLRPQAPVVVVDNGSCDDTSAAVRARFPDVAVLTLPANVGAVGRNAGLAHAATPYVALCDDDTWWEPGALTRAADALDAHATLAVVTARVLVGAEERLDPTCARMACSPLPAVDGLPGRPILGFLAGASVVRRAPVLAAGGFEARLFLGGEEELLALDLAAAGWRLAYLPELVVHHHPSPRRDAAARRRLLLRNALWCTWLRRPLPNAVQRTVALLRAHGRVDAELLRALGATARGTRWVLRQRRALPASIVAALRLLESADRPGGPDAAALCSLDGSCCTPWPARVRRAWRRVVRPSGTRAADVRMRTHPTIWALGLALLAAAGCGDRPPEDARPPTQPQAKAGPDPESDVAGERGMGANREVPRTGATDENDDDAR